MLTGLDRLQHEPELLEHLHGRVGYLGHSASVDRNLQHGADILHRLLGSRLTALFGPQHGFNTDAQDNMIESPHQEHTVYGIPVFSLYSETREPTAEMLQHIDTLVIDLSDIGVRVYTYIWTMILAMKACHQHGVRVVILDRPNPLDGVTIEGNLLQPAFSSFVGLHPLPMRHGMTAGEVARYASRYWDAGDEPVVIGCTGWNRRSGFTETGLPWVLPSPNLATLHTLSVYPGFVLMEGTVLSEGRGTVRPFELFGHPRLLAHTHVRAINQALQQGGCELFRLRPHTFVPTFEKWQGQNCHGYQVHVANSAGEPTSGSWKAAQIVLRELYHRMGTDFGWRPPPFEYENDAMPIDILNGTDTLRLWIERNGSTQELTEIENSGREEFLQQRSAILLYT